jgi:hypothetical protein
MQDTPRRAKLLIVLLLIMASISVSESQERAPNGQIYGELQPFVGLDGVRFELHGIGNSVYNVVSVTGDPQTELTGLNRAQTEELYRSIRADADEAFSDAGIPLLSNRTDGPETRPRLVVDVSWYRATPELFVVLIDIRLMEPARLLKDPDKVVWTSSWQESFRPTATKATIAQTLRSGVKGELSSFIRLYKRAHAKAG